MGYPVIFYDQGGCGDSTFVEDPAKDAPWLLTLEYYLEELNQLIKHLQIPEYYVYGSSWGSMVRQTSHLLMRLILLGCSRVCYHPALWASWSDPRWNTL